VVRKELDLLAFPPRPLLLEGLQHPLAQGAAALAQQALVGDLQGQCVLVGVLEIGKETRLVEELSGL
jgi:hypothetical protein